ncbi:rab-like GTPase activating protein [Lotmaria passim]
MIGSTTARGNLYIYPHAEEVELRDGVSMAPIFSTTGRQNQVLGCEADESTKEFEQPPTVPSPLRGVSASQKCHGNGGATVTNTTAAQAASNGSSHTHTTGSTCRTRYQCYDMYGFSVTAEEKAAEDFARHHHAYKENDQDSWNYIVTHWMTADRVKIKRLCRRGIPQPRRCVVWQRLLQSWGVKERYPGLYFRLRSQAIVSSDLASVIERDLDRTFPTHRLFADGAQGPGQQMLRNILRAYANYNVKVGYCQGMGFLAATLILQIEEEEDAFWGFVGLMEGKKYKLGAVFSPGFPELQCIFYVFEGLLKRKLPALYRQLHDKNQIPPSFYSTHWFMTVFTYYFNFGLVSRIWDMFLCEGWKPVYRVALALLKLEEKNLLKLNSETDILLALKVIQESKKPEALLKVASHIKFKTSTMIKLTEEYKRQTAQK